MDNMSAIYYEERHYLPRMFAIQKFLKGSLEQRTVSISLPRSIEIKDTHREIFPKNYLQYFVIISDYINKY